MMRSAILLVIMLCVITPSCRTQEQNKQEAKQIVQQRLSGINFSQTDQMPLFKDCDEMENASICFYEKLCAQVEAKLLNHQLQFEITKRDSVTAVILVNDNGEISYKGLNSNPVNQKEIVVDSLLKNRLKDFIKIEPAIKQGIPVNSSYLLPVIIKPAMN